MIRPWLKIGSSIPNLSQQNPVPVQWHKKPKKILYRPWPIRIPSAVEFCSMNTNLEKKQTEDSLQKSDCPLPLPLWLHSALWILAGSGQNILIGDNLIEVGGRGRGCCPLTTTLCTLELKWNGTTYGKPTPQAFRVLVFLHFSVLPCTVWINAITCCRGRLILLRAVSTKE